jgi:saccharopine dehydrogenase-like NADP-dependent oxidoreductase
MDTVRIGIIGTGFRGQSHLEMLCQRKDTNIVAFADPDPRMLADAQKILKDAGRPAAVEYSKGKENYIQLLQRNDIDAVIIATPWEWHIPQALEAIKNGIIPPTINFVNTDEALDPKLNFTFNKAQHREVNVGMTNTFGFGGHNGCIVIGPAD